MCAASLRTGETIRILGFSTERLRARRRLPASTAVRSGRRAAAPARVHELAMPELEHEQRPDRLASPSAPAAWRSMQPADRAPARSSRGRASRGSSRTSRDLVRQFGAQPVAQRNREALLGAVQDVVGQPPAQRLAQDPLLLRCRAPSGRPGSTPRAPSARGRGTASAPRARAPSSRCRSWRSGRRRGRWTTSTSSIMSTTASPGRRPPRAADDRASPASRADRARTPACRASRAPALRRSHDSIARNASARSSASARVSRRARLRRLLTRSPSGGRRVARRLPRPRRSGRGQPHPAAPPAALAT